MPLLNSPVDGAPMKQINRYGIEIDVCPATGGVWLDKGELEKLMALLKEELVNEERESQLPRERTNMGRRNDFDDDDDDGRHERDGREYNGGYRRKSKMSRIMDIFDF